MDERRRRRAHAVVALVNAGWRPPPLRNDQAQRLLDDMERIGGDMRGRQPRSESLNLTADERRTLQLEADGLTRKQIADELDRGAETIKRREQRIRAKLGARNMPHAVALALRNRIIR